MTTRSACLHPSPPSPRFSQRYAMERLHNTHQIETAYLPMLAPALCGSHVKAPPSTLGASFAALVPRTPPSAADWAKSAETPFTPDHADGDTATRTAMAVPRQAVRLPAQAVTHGSRKAVENRGLPSPRQRPAPGFPHSVEKTARPGNTPPWHRRCIARSHSHPRT